MVAKTVLFATIAALVGLLGLAGTASAHATAYSADNKLKFVYGSLNEPIYTFQKTGLDLGIFDNATGKAIGGLVPSTGQPTFTMHLVYGSQSLDLTGNLSEQHGKPGWYTHPYMLTQPGVYAIRIQGTINQTALDQTIQAKHELQSIGEIMWPTKVDAPGDQASKVAALEAEVDALKAELATVKTNSAKGGNAAGLDALVLIGLAGVALVALRRRTG